MNRFKKAAIAAGVSLTLALTGCSSDADVASENLSKSSDNFEIARRIVFLNGITDTYLLEIQGLCSIAVDTGESQLEVTCKVDGGFKKHFLGLSNNVTYFIEQLDAAKVSTSQYKVIFKPSVIIPEIEMR